MLPYPRTSSAAGVLILQHSIVLLLDHVARFQDIADRLAKPSRKVSQRATLTMSLPAETKQWLYTAPPQGLPTLSGTNPTFSLKKTRLAPLQTNQVLLRTVYISNDPAQRGWISPMADPSRLYTKPVPLNTCMRAQALCEVLDSKAAQFSKGDHVLATSGWAEYAVVSARECQPAPPLPGNVRETHYLGALGAPGVTAYYGLVEVARTKPTDVVVVSGAAGATGSMAVQIARGLLGSRKVVGIAGGARPHRQRQTCRAAMFADRGLGDRQVEMRLRQGPRRRRLRRLQERHVPQGPVQGDGPQSRRLLRQCRRQHSEPDAHLHGQVSHSPRPGNLESD